MGPLHYLIRFFHDFRWHLQTGALSTGGISHGTTQSEVFDQDLPSQHRSVVHLSVGLYLPKTNLLSLDKLGRICLDILKGRVLF